MTWHHGRETRVSTASVVAVTWTNHVMTRGMMRLGKKNATWPTHRVPRGAVLLAIGLCYKIWFWTPGDSNRDLRAGTDLTTRANHGPGVNLLYESATFAFKLEKVYTAGKRAGA
jgi:hypothetical protein